MHRAGEFLYGDPGAEVFTDVGNGAIQLHVGLQHLAAMLVALHGSHQADETSATVEKRELVSDEPIGDPLVSEEEFDDVHFRLAGAHHFLVVATETLSDPCGE